MFFWLSQLYYPKNSGCYLLHMTFATYIIDNEQAVLVYYQKKIIGYFYEFINNVRGVECAGRETSSLRRFTNYRLFQRWLL